MKRLLKSSTKKWNTKIGEKFGQLTIVAKASSGNYGKTRWKCKCSCGNTTVVMAQNLKTGRTKSCGCRKTGCQMKDLTGQKFSRLTVLCFAGKRDASYDSFWKCKCECGNTVVIRRRALITGRQKSCGCLFKEQSYHLRGKDNPCWNDSLTDVERVLHRLTDGYQKWRREVKEKYNFTCVACDKRGGELASHHLNSYRNFPEQRLDLNNGICLCYKCHRKFHREYGEGNNTKEQFIDWLKDLRKTNERTDM